MRKTKITEAEMLEYLNRYYLEECDGIASRLKMSDFSRYLASLGVQYSYDALRKNVTAVDFIKTQKASELDEDFRTLATYKTLDVNEFIGKNNTKEKMTAALVQLDTYYAQVAKSAFRFYEDIEKLRDKIGGLNKQISNLTEKAETLQSRLEEQTDELKNVRDTNKYLKEYINENIYKGFAEALLAERGISSNTGFEEHIIKEDDVITKLKEGFE